MRRTLLGHLCPVCGQDVRGNLLDMMHHLRAHTKEECARASEERARALREYRGGERA